MPAVNVSPVCILSMRFACILSMRLQNVNKSKNPFFGPSIPKPTGHNLQLVLQNAEV